MIPEKIKQTQISYKELKDYPRNVSHYFMKYSSEIANKIQQTAKTEEEQLILIRKIEIEKMYRELANYINIEVKNVFEYINKIDNNELLNLPAKNKQNYDDALVTTKTVLSQLNKVLLMLKTFEFK